jgi:hypothetical protein
VIRVLMVITGAVVLVVLGAAVIADPHLQWQLIAQLDHQARSHGSQLDSRLARLVRPRSTP